MIREIKELEKKEFDKVATHPLQSWAWGDFRKTTGVEVTRLGKFEEKKLVATYQITWHRIPKTKWFIGYCPKSILPGEDALAKIIEVAKKRGAIMVKFEPNRRLDDKAINEISDLKNRFNLVKGKSLFTKYTFWLDITKSEDELLKNMHQKTRYNIRLAEKKGVKIIEDNSDQGFEDYWKLMEETTKRQGFYAHGKSYHRKMWTEMHKNGGAHLFKAVFGEKVLTTWILFELNGVLYYPYGASSSENRELMSSNLMMWEVIKFGKKLKFKLLDMWGSLGPEPDEKDPWFGFHRFKQGYGPELVEFLGTYDLVVNPTMYQIYGMIDKVRWVFLKSLARFRK